MDLHNHHNVYILGAGFSCDAGLPVLSNFLLCMRDSHPWLIAQGRVAEADAVKEILEFRLNAASASYWATLDLENIEELFSLASAIGGTLGEKVQLAIAATVDFVVSTANRDTGKIHIKDLPCVGQFQWLTPIVPSAQDFSTSRYAHHVGKLLGLFDTGTPCGENTFVTFNYDTVLEDALSTLRIPFSYGFRKKTVYYHPASAKATKASTATKVLKLHGSVNWARGSGRKYAFVVFGNYSNVRSDSLTPELLPPTWKKDFSDHLLEVWESAIESLATATRIVVIGFSLPPTDLHFKYLIAAGLQDNVSLREIVFVNPSAGEIATRVTGLLRKQYIEQRRIRFEAMRMEDFVNHNSMLSGIGRPIHRHADIRFI